MNYSLKFELHEMTSVEEELWDVTTYKYNYTSEIYIELVNVQLSTEGVYLYKDWE